MAGLLSFSAALSGAAARRAGGWSDQAQGAPERWVRHRASHAMWSRALSEVAAGMPQL